MEGGVYFQPFLFNLFHSFSLAVLPETRGVTAGALGGSGLDVFTIVGDTARAVVAATAPRAFWGHIRAMDHFLPLDQASSPREVESWNLMSKKDNQAWWNTVQIAGSGENPKRAPFLI